MKTYEFYKGLGKNDAWIEKNIEGLCGDCEMVRSPEYDDGSDAYIADGYVLHICHSADDVIESLDENGEVIESWCLDN
jgi:hypothetical protein